MKNEGNSASSQPARTYISYLLRLWRSSEEPGGWRISLEKAQSGERLGFASLEPLFLYLLEQTENPEVLDNGPRSPPNG